MNPDQDSGSLADRAAAWVPPWERPADREATDDQPREDQPREGVEADEGLDEAAALDREIDADIVREAGLPGPGTVESDDAEIDLTEIVAMADTDITVEPQADAEAAGEFEVGASADFDAEAAAEVEVEAGADTDAEAGPAADTEVDAEAGPDTDAEAGPETETETSPDTLLGAGPSPLPGLAGAELGAALEAILMVVDEPVTEAQLADVLDVAPEDVAERLRALASDYAETGRGFELRRAAGGWRFYTRAEFSGYVERFVLDGQSARLTQAALETLAVVAYQQPVTRSRISAIRGVNCDGVVRTLVTRGLLEESGTQPETGAYLYRTTTLFLEKLGLDSVDELPPLAPFLPDDVNGLTDAQR